MGKWSSVLRWVAKPITSPGATGRAIKSATIGAGVGYIGWEALINDKPVVQTIGELAVGEETNEAIKETVSSVASTTSDLVGGVKDAVTGVSEAAGNVNATWGGVGTFMQDLTSGNGGNMFNNFFSNIFSGKVSMMSMLGLVTSALLIFGRFGWLGKIAGTLMGMLLIGNNSRQQLQVATTEKKQDAVIDSKVTETENQRPAIRR